MTPKRTNKKPTRITVDLSSTDYERLGRMTKMMGAVTQVAAVRRAIVMFDFFVRKSADGYEFFAIKGDERYRIPIVKA